MSIENTVTKPAVLVGEVNVRRFFEFTLLQKMLHNIFEIAAGTVLAVLNPSTIVAMATFLTRYELSEDPNDVVARFLMHTAEGLASGSKAAATFFLLSHGVVKLALVAAVMKGWPRAYPAFIAALGLLIAYQTYMLMVAFSWWLIALTAFDGVVLAPACHEYRLVGSAPQRVSTS